MAKKPERVALTMPLERQARLRKLMADRLVKERKTQEFSSIVNEAVEGLLTSEGY